jgi:ATP-dependent Lon protease
MTGQMEDVMKESTAIAYTFSKSFLSILDPPNSFLGSWGNNGNQKQGPFQQ